MAVLDYEPKQFVKGESVSWTRSFTDYPAGTWALNYYFRGRDHGFNVTATADGTAFVAEIPSLTGKDPGFYQWQAFVTKDSQKILVDSGKVEILPDLSAIHETAGFDERSQAEIDLEAVRLMISGKAAKDVQEYQINNRQLRHIPISELLKLEENLMSRVMREKRAKRRKRGGAFFKTVNVRLNDE